jgi:RNA methyltransferase, TrmH family
VTSHAAVASVADLKRIRRLTSKRSERWRESACVLEGPDVVRAAVDAHVALTMVVVTPEGIERFRELLAMCAARGIPVRQTEPAALAKVVDADTTQGIVGVSPFVHLDLSSIKHTGPVLVLHDVRDPGNVGTAIRVADAAGAVAVVLSGQCADLYNAKVLRASAGSVFQVPVAIAPTLDAVRHWAAPEPLTLTVVRGGADYRRTDLSGAPVVVLGNEATGLPASECASEDRLLSIPMAGMAESLNVGVAAAVVLFEALGQRRVPFPPEHFGTMESS